MFRGEFTHSLDAKGRIILPQKLRDGLGDKFIITRGLVKCLYVFTLEDWKSYEEKAKGLPITDQKAQQFLRFFMGGAFDAETDVQGRTIVPPHLRKHADFKKEIITFGVTNRVEVWAKEAWDEYNAAVNYVDSELAEYMKVLGF
jgi:MraZ protein